MKKAMLKLEAIVKPLLIDVLIERLIEVGVHSISYSEVSSANQALYRRNREEGVDKRVEFYPCAKIEVILDKDHLMAVEEALAAELSSPMHGGAEVTVFRLKEGIRMLGATKADTTIEEI